MKQEEPKQEYYQCECSTHAIHITKYPDDSVFYISIWERGKNNVTTWAHRLCHIWKIIKTGEPYGDEVVLSKKTATALARFINHESK